MTPFSWARSAGRGCNRRVATDRCDNTPQWARPLRWVAICGRQRGVGDRIKLNKKTWELGARIGDPSGFGRVFEATADDGEVAVVKLIPKEPGADRELL